ncbi:MurR/RpiR family transcriptional regulator [Lysinibacillus piscis]|uniref:RpiR family transcriptional regulator n=1 Tax=Lysinibacillus piscis TaxID=2518931 RepID=A0ABQ5NM82_9BACI|nr:MurR/RpiR family transcriptional regulator [Lysinibacillus sp. KH24]GLC89445.1 RpiR family transcriptional regulator [Lysinibacillus sp. KH24]
MNIKEEIQRRFVHLSKGQRKVAQFVLNNPTVIVNNGAAEVGRQANVSESTVIRFCYAMDLSGFVELQEGIRHMLLSQKPALQVERQSAVEQTMQHDIQNIQNTMLLINEQLFHRSAKWMHEAEAIYIVGTYQTTPTVQWLLYTLKTLRSHVYLVDSMQQVKNMNENTVLIVFAYDTSFHDMQPVVENAKARRVKIIALSGSALTPIREYTNVLFTLSMTQSLLSHSVPVVLFSFFNALLDTMINHNLVQYEQYQKTNERGVQNILYFNTAREKHGL